MRRPATACRTGGDSLDPRRCEELKGDAVGVAERDARTVGSIPDAVVRDAELVQAIGPLLQLLAATAGEGDVVETGVALVEGSGARLGMGVQSEQLAAREGVDGVVEGAALLVLVQNGLGTEQRRVPLGTAAQVGDGHGDVRQRRELGHGSVSSVRADVTSNLL